MKESLIYLILESTKNFGYRLFFLSIFFAYHCESTAETYLLSPYLFRLLCKYILDKICASAAVHGRTWHFLGVLWNLKGLVHDQLQDINSHDFLLHQGLKKPQGQDCRTVSPFNILFSLWLGFLSATQLVGGFWGHFSSVCALIGSYSL